VVVPFPATPVTTDAVPSDVTPVTAVAVPSPATPVTTVAVPDALAPVELIEVTTGILVPLDTFLVPLVAASYASNDPEPPEKLP
jgi:hypothetical protein